MARKFGKRTLPRGIHIRAGKYVVVQVDHQGVTVARKQIGTLTDNETTNRRLLEDAEAHLRDVLENIRTGKLGLEGRYQSWTIEQGCDKYWEIHGQKMPTAYTESLYLKFIKELFPLRRLETFNRLDIERLREAVLARPGIKKESSVNRYHTVFSKIFNMLRKWSHDEKIIPLIKLPAVNPARLVKKVDERKFRRKRIVSEQDFYKVYNYATPRLQNNMLMAVNTLLSKADLNSLTVSANVNWDTCQLYGVRSKTEESSGEPYCLALTETTLDIVNARKGDKILDFTNHRREFAAALTKAGVPVFLFKDLRRTGARMLLKQGVDIDTIRQMLCHTDIATTQIYIGAEEEDRRKAAVILSSAFPRPQVHTPAPTSKNNVVGNGDGDSAKIQAAH